ncbi:Uncharacterised protein [Clostridium botulinum]|nr:Uncharacterised protein [Clostridium botulinum]
MTSVSLYKIKLAEVIIFILLNLFVTPNALKIYTRFGLLKRGICGVKGIRKSLEILICFLKIY